MKKHCQIAFALLQFIILYGQTSCTNNSNIEIAPAVYYPSDPNKEVTFSDYDPTSGVAHTQMFIRGSNFGTDISKIHVTIGGKQAKILTSNGNEIYCLVPPRADKGDVEVEIERGEGKENIKHSYEEKFEYFYSTVVGTLCGKVDDQGRGAIVDGTFDEARWNTPMAMIMDNKNGNQDIYVVEEKNCLRKIDLKTKTVSTVIAKGTANWSNPEGMSWSPDKDTLWITEDQSAEKSIGLYYLTRKENFSVPHVAAIGYSHNALLVHPKDGTIFIIRGRDAVILKCIYDPITRQWIPTKTTDFGRTDQWFYSAVFHPTGKYAYCVGRGVGYIAKALYDDNKHELLPPSIFVGDIGKNRYEDGVGTKARFSEPLQGCFVRNEEYVREGKEDEYDFYVTDTNNHCIRKVTPDGIVTTYAGRGSWSADEIRYGYIDGDPCETARFNRPMGICYDEIDATFYIGDYANHRIRSIAIQ